MFCWWKNRFNCLHSGLRVDPEKVCTIIMVCAVLHNIAIKLREPLEYVLDADLDDASINIPFRGPEQGRIFNDHIVRNFFS